MADRQVALLDVRIDDCSLDEAIARVERFFHEPRLHQIVTPGPEFLLEARENPSFREVLKQSDLAIPDGFGLKVAAGLIGQPLRNRVPGVDFVLALLEWAAKHHKRVFLYGAQPGVAEKATINLLRRYPGLAIVGHESGYRGVWQQLKDHQIIHKIHRAKPDILLVALGAPRQELWIAKHRKAFHQVTIAVGVGRTFDYLSGHVQRPPAIVRRFGFEWLYTYLNAKQLHRPELRRQRVHNATWHFLKAVFSHHYGRK